VAHVSSDTQKPRVLLIAEAANPEWVSVPLIGWSLAQALAAEVDVHLVTQVRNREALLRAGLVEGDDFTAIDSEAITKPLHHLAEKLSGGANRGWTIKAAINRFGYPYFERLVWKTFGDDLKAGKYDLVHRITPLSPAITSPIAARLKAIGVPFVLGPLNGGVPWPEGFEEERRREGEKLSALRGLYKYLPGRKRMLRASSAILAATKIAIRELPEDIHARVIHLPENAIDPARFNLVAAQPGTLPLKASFVGRLVPLKGVDMLIEAATPMLADGRMTLDIIGDGPMRTRLEAQAHEAGVSKAVTFHGNLPHSDVQKVLSTTHLMTFPSIREFGGGVVLEAMALGVVPMVVDYAGPAELVEDATGYRIPLGNREVIIAGYRAALEALVANPAELETKSEAGRARIAEMFTWAAKARQLCSVYEWVLGTTDTKPELF